MASNAEMAVTYIGILDSYIHVMYMFAHYEGCRGTPPLRGLLRLAILCIVKQKPTYGSEIHRELKERFKIDVPKALVYTLLRRMEKRGLVTSTWDIRESGPARRVYRITEEGLDNLLKATRKLKEAIPIIEAIVSAVEEE